MKSIIAFGASNSRKSINKQFATYAARQLNNVEATILDLNEYEMPIYSIDRERQDGIPTLAKNFKEKIMEADGILISFAEHNGAYTAAFKNIMDWISRLEGKTWSNKPMLLLSTSPGKRGAKSVLQIAATSFQFSNASPIVTFSLPLFRQNFEAGKGISDSVLENQFREVLKQFEAIL